LTAAAPGAKLPAPSRVQIRRDGIGPPRAFLEERLDRVRTYLRMIKMIKPYAWQLVLAIIFMVLFSVMSLFSISMIPAFLEGFFTEPQPVAVSDDRSAAEDAALSDDGITTDDQTALDNQATTDDQARPELLDRVENLDSEVKGLKERFQHAISSYLLRGDRQDALLRVCWIFCVLVLLRNLTGYVQAILMAFVSLSVIRDLRDRLFVKFTAMPLSFYHQHKAGELISRATNDVQIASNCVNVSFTNLVRDPIMIIMYLGAAFFLSWKLTLMAVVLLPISLLGIVKIGQKLRKYSHRQQEQMAQLTAVLQETVYGIRVIKAFAMERFENRKYLRESRRLFSAIFKIHRVSRISAPLAEQLSVVVGLFLLWYGGRLVFVEQSLSPGFFMMFLFLIFSLVHPIKELGQVNASIQEGMAAADRIFQVLDAQPEVVDTGAGQGLDRVDGRVEFQDVHFAYNSDEPVLQGIDLTVQPGEVVALVGPSGGGKSTLIDLIPRFYDPQRGAVRIDGRDLRELNLASLRQAMGIVTQEVILFNDTVRNNIAYGIADIADEDVAAAAEAANAHGFVSQMPAGYETIIGDRGVKLSGGQRQRISIARAILKNPPILLLDEATSALDTESELLVQEAIDRLVRSRTTIVIAHRLSTIKNVDRIYVVEAGRIVQEGAHDELLAAGGVYKDLYELQFSK